MEISGIHTLVHISSLCFHYTYFLFTMYATIFFRHDEALNNSKVRQVSLLHFLPTAQILFQLSIGLLGVQISCTSLLNY